MDAYEFYKCPSWVFPTAVVVDKGDGFQAVIIRIDWNRCEVYYRPDGSERELSTPFANFFGRFKPYWDADGKQVSGMTVGMKRDIPLLQACAWSTRAITIVKREGWDKLTVGEFVAKVSIPEVREKRGAGRGVVAEFVRRIAESGMKMRRFAGELED